MVHGLNYPVAYALMDIFIKDFNKYSYNYGE